MKSSADNISRSLTASGCQTRSREDDCTAPLLCWIYAMVCHQGIHDSSIEAWSEVSHPIQLKRVAYCNTNNWPRINNNRIPLCYRYVGCKFIYPLPILQNARCQQSSSCYPLSHLFHVNQHHRRLSSRPHSPQIPEIHRLQHQRPSVFYQVMPFGLELGPLIFATVITPILKLLHSQKIWAAVYIDDCLLWARDSLTLQENTLHSKPYHPWGSKSM